MRNSLQSWLQYNFAVFHEWQKSLILVVRNVVRKQALFARGFSEIISQAEENIGHQRDLRFTQSLNFLSKLGIRLFGSFIHKTSFREQFCPVGRTYPVYVNKFLIMKTLIFTLLCSLSICAFTNAAPETVHFQFATNQFEGHFGIVAIGNGGPGKIIGSGFAFGENKEIVTCDHVVAAAKMLNQLTNLTFISGNQASPIRLKFRLPKFDLAILAPELSIGGPPLRVGDFRKIRPGDQVVYIGYDQAASTNEPINLVNMAVVTATGSALNEGRTVDFLEFEGIGRPGYSGGAVLNSQGELVAVMREAWTKQGVKGGLPILINRAFSLEVLTLEGEVYTSSEPSTDNTGTSATLLDLINVSSPVSTNSTPASK
jgi:hypothetical protein